MIRFPQFRRKYMSFRVGQFRMLNNLSEIPELCFGSVVHVLDNFQMNGHVNYGPAVDNPILAMNNYKLGIFNVSQPVDGPVPIATNKMVMTNAGLLSQYMSYKQAMSPRVLYFNDLKALPNRASAQAVVNYNPLFRARVLGMRRKVRLMNMVLGSIINTIVKMPDRLHFIHIPLESLMFERKDFARLFNKFDRVATKYPEVASYLFLANLYSYLMQRIDLPPRGISVEDEEGDNAVESFQIDPAEYDDSLTASEFFNNIQESIKNAGAALEFIKLKDGENPYKRSIFEFLDPRWLEKINLILTCGGQYIIYNLRDLKELNGNTGAGIHRIIKHINLLTASGDAAAAEMPVEEVPMVSEDVVRVDTVTDDKLPNANQPEYKEPMSKDEKLEAADIDLTELDNIEKIVEESSRNLDKPLTRAQKDHIVQIGKAYKKLDYGGKTFEEILGHVPDEVFKLPELKTESIKSGDVSPEATKSKTVTMDATYVTTGQMDRDIAQVLTSFNKQGMFLVDFKVEDQVDELNELRSYTAKYEDVNHKKHTIKFQLPKVDEFGRAKVNGSLKAMSKQRVANPICKVSPRRVTLNSNYNKLLVERNENVAHDFLSWFLNALRKAAVNGWVYRATHHHPSYPLKAFPFELTEIGRKYSLIEFNGGLITTDIMNRGKSVPVAFQQAVAKLEKEQGYWFGYKGEDLFFINNMGQVSVRNAKTNEEPFYGAFIDFMEWLTGTELSPMVEFVELTILSKTIPIITALAYRYGLTEMLKYTGADYDVFDINQRIERATSDIVIKFADKKLVIRRTPRNCALIFGGLCIYDFSEVAFEDMDGKDVYYSMLDQKKISTNLIKGINSLFDLFIDPITRDVLREMKEPTDLRDLLIRATTMLTTTEHKDEAAAANFRFRGVEQMPGIVYNELAKALATYRNRARGATNHFSVKEYAVKQRIAQEQLTENVSIINPLDDIKQVSKFSNAGSGGRSNDTFKIPDRKFTADQIGIVSEATVDNGKVGLNATLPADPILVSNRGMAGADIDLSKLKPENVLSFNSLIQPCVTQDDGKRANFSSIQSSHIVPIAESDVSRVRTGYEEMVAQRTRPPFAFTAHGEGTVLDVDEKNGVMKVQMKNGEKKCIEFGSVFTNNSANGFYVDQEIVVNNFKKGDKFKEGDVLAYNHQFFQADPYSKQVRYKNGILAKVAILDNGGTIEDASILTSNLTDRMTFCPVHVKEIVLTTSTNIHQFAFEGTEVASTDPLLIYDESAMDFGEEDDPEMIEMLQNMNKQAPKAGHSGVIAQVDVLYKSSLSSMSGSIRKIIEKITEKKNAKAAFAADCDNMKDFQKSRPLVATQKVGIVDLNEETVIFRFYIKQNKGMSAGDKLFFDSSLKSVCSQVVPGSIMTEDGHKVDACTSGRGILARIITSPFVTGIGNAVCHKLEDNVIAVWDGNEPIDENA